jgi:hypothetical protein
MVIDEVQVYLTPDGLGRAAIVKRPDGLLCIYIHLHVPRSPYLQGSGGSWLNDKTPRDVLYKDTEPRVGLYGTVEDAQREVRSIPGFADAVLKMG